MKNKKLRLFIIAVLVLQLLMPAGTLWYHYSQYDNAMKESPEFKFRINYMYIWGYEESGENLQLELEGTYYSSRHEAKAVTVGADGFAIISKAENKKLNKHWFWLDNYRKLTSYHENEGEFTYVDTPEANAVMDKWRNNPHNDLGEVLDYQGGNTMYVTAKVYKGLIIPTAVYNLDVKIIDLHYMSK